MKTYSYDETLAMLTEVIDEEGYDFVYAADRRHSGEHIVDCYYLSPEDETKGDCGVGRVLLKAGLPASTLKELEGNMVESVLRHLSDLDLMHFDDRSKALLWTFQDEQDRGTPWGLALWRANQHT